MARIPTAKVLIVGDANVGKTSVLHRFAYNKFPLQQVPTIGSDFKKRTIEVDGSFIQLEIWDTGGQERYNMSITSRFFCGSNGVMLVFDVTNMGSFAGIQKWVEEVEYHEIPRWKCFLVGNKMDLDNERAVDSTLASSLAHRLGVPYIETSARDGTNVQQAFDALARQMMQQMKLNTPRTGTSFSLMEYYDENNGTKNGWQQFYNKCSV